MNYDEFQQIDESGDILSIFTARLQAVLYERGMQQKELACSCGFSAARLNNYINGRTEPSIDALVSICNALSVSADYLIGLSDTMLSASIVTIPPASQLRSELDDLSPDRRHQAEEFLCFLRQQQAAEERQSKQEA